MDCWHGNMDSSNPSKDVLQSYQRLGSDFGGPNTERPHHSGIDEDCNEGDPVYSTFDGTVRKILLESTEEGKESGNSVGIVPLSSSDTAWFEHLSQISVRENQTVKVGDLLGRCGKTGNATGPHLHYEVDCPAGTPDCRCAPNPKNPTQQDCMRNPETVHPCGS
jgi:murein DD-endopeptidase MepM/ murein hydrolase activator NlpD